MRAPRTVRLRTRRWLAATPGWVRVLLAAATTVLGAVMLLRPATSLGVLALLIGAGLILHGIVDLVGPSSARRPERWWPLLAGLWATAGVIVLVLPGLTVRVLAVVVGISLVVNGALLIVSAFRRHTAAGDRIADAAFGVAGVVFGVLALSWPDITSIVVAVVFGARLVMTGLALGWATLRGREKLFASAGPRPRPRRARPVAAVASVVLAAGAAVVSGAIHDGAPEVDAFYLPPSDIPDAPGELIRAEPFTREVPDGAEAWRILYTTTRGDGGTAVASGLVVVPADGRGPWPVVDWNHGTTGVAQHCAPSLAEEPFASGALLILPEVIAEGWALVATDYIGLGTPGPEGPHPYLIGPDTAHASLDAVRAAHQLEDARLAEETVVWGHSQGGGAALWAGAVMDEYAPELAIHGIAAMAPSSDLRGLVETLSDLAVGNILASYVAAAYTAEYDDVTYDEYVRPGAEVIARQMAERCLISPGVIVSALAALALSPEPTILSEAPTTGAFGARLAQNEPPATIPVPLLVGQGAADGLITPELQDGYVDRLCTAGLAVDYRLYADRNHLSLVTPDSPLVPELLAWTQDRFDGVPAVPECTRSGP